VALVDVNGAPVHVDRRGARTGEPLLLVQGLSGHSAHWGQPFLSGLSGLDLIAYDHRNTGRSARRPGAFTIADLADDAARLLDVLGLARAHVLGISMGGMVAQELALRHPDRVGALVIGCSYPGGQGSVLTSGEVIQELAGGLLGGDPARAQRAAWQVNVSAAAARDEALFEAFSALARVDPVPLEVMMSQFRAVMGHDASARLSAVTAPTLVIHGDEDRLLPVANGRLIAARIPEARLEVLGSVGHLFFVERPERSARLVRDWVAGHALVAPAQ